MRISSGILKGRNVLAPEGRDVRPTSAKVRESIFDTLQGEVKGCRFLDLFAGSGAVGIEAYSRGAGEVYFCERNRDVLPLLRQNVSLLKGAGRIFEGDAFAVLERLPGGFDVIFNTVPSMVLSRALLEEVKRGCVVIDVASEPGGVDFAAADELGVRVFWARALPGKVAPETAAKVIRDAIYHILEERGEPI